MAPQAPASDGRMAAANNAFAIDLYGELGAGNVFFSPNSIELALAMAFSGARGATADEMAKVLHFTAPEDAGSLGAFAAALNAPTAPDGKPRGYVLSEANALWVQKGQAILQQYLDLLRERFGAPPREVDFANDPAGATRAINTWVARNTNDKIKELMRAGDVTRETRLVLTNAIYFKGTWAAPFAEIQTRPEAFRTAAGQEEKPPMMHRTGDYAIFENGDLQALKLPYSGGELSMVVLLPRRPEGLPALDKSLTAASLDAWIGGAAREKVQVTLPKFTVEGRFLLADPLSTSGWPPRSAPEPISPASRAARISRSRKSSTRPSSPWTRRAPKPPRRPRWASGRPRWSARRPRRSSVPIIPSCSSSATRPRARSSSWEG